MTLHVGAGQLRTLAELQRKVETVTPAGGREVTWVRERDVWCRIEGLSARLKVEAMAREPQITHEIVTRKEVGATFDYTDFTEFYDCSGVGNLLGENGDILIEQFAVAEISDGKFGTARGPFSTSSRFQRTGTGIWDTRVVSGFTKGSLVAWFRTTSNTAIQTLARQGNTAVSNQWNLRCVWPDGAGAGDDAAILLIYDWALDNGTYQVGGGVRVDEGAFPLNAWCMIGFSVDLSAELARLFLGVPGEGTYFDERSIAGWDAFQSPNASTIVVGANNTVEPLLGGVDHITWTNGRAYAQEDFMNHWKDGNGLSREAYSHIGGNEIDATTRLVLGSRVFMIAGMPEEVDERGRLIRLLAVEGVAT